MNLSIIDKIVTVLKYIFSSFLSIELFIFSILLFVFLIINFKKKNKFIQILIIGIYIGFLLGIVLSYSMYVKSCIDSLVKVIINYIYFPSTIMYFFIILFVTGVLFYTVFSKKLSDFKKIVNFTIFSILYYFFTSFIALATSDGVDLLDVVTLYKNDTILSIVQVSNFILLIWLLFTGFYYLYKYFKKRFD